MLPPVYQRLMATPVAALTGGRIYRHGSAPQDVARPYITWALIAGTPQNTLSETPGVDQMSIQVDCWALGDAEVDTLATAVRDAIEPIAHMTSIPIDSQETDTKLYRMTLQFDWWLYRPGP